MMTQDTLNEREFELINVIGAELGSNQRELSRHMDLSLGMVNMLIRRLISKGFIRIRQLNKRKVEYILTPKGFSEKMRKSVKYTLNTLNSISLIKDRLKIVLSELVNKGERDFILLGKSDFVLLVEIVLKELCVEGYTVGHVDKDPGKMVKGTLLICEETFNEGEIQKQRNGCLNLVEELAKNFPPQLIGAR